MHKRLLTVALVLGTTCIASSALAQATPCASRAAIVERLTTKYDEELTAQGMQNTGTLIEVFASRDKGSFTVLVSRADGRSCILAAGEHWNGLFPKVDPNDPMG